MKIKIELEIPDEGKSCEDCIFWDEVPFETISKVEYCKLLSYQGLFISGSEIKNGERPQRCPVIYRGEKREK